MKLFCLALIVVALFACGSLAQNCALNNGNCAMCIAEDGCGFCYASQQCRKIADVSSGAEKCYVNFFTKDTGCPDCGSHLSCGECTTSSLACAWCTEDNRCVNADNRESVTNPCAGLLKHTCDCRKNLDCDTCTGDNQNCSWCPASQSCQDYGDAASCPGGLLAHTCPTCDTITDCTLCNDQLNKCNYCLDGDAGSCQAVGKPCKQKIDVCATQCSALKTCVACISQHDCRWDERNVCRGALSSEYGFVGHTCEISSFDGGSFVGGMFLIIGLIGLGVVGYFAFRYYQRRRAEYVVET